MPAIAAGVAALIAGLVLRRTLRWLGREEVVGDGATDVAFADGTGGPIRRIDSARLAELAAIEFAPPRDTTAWQGGIVNAEEVAERHEVAWLIEAAIDGYIELDETDGLTLRRKEHAADDTTVLLDVGFAGRDSVELGKYDPSFGKMWSRLYTHLDSWFTSSGLWDPVGRRHQRVAHWLGLLGIVAGAAGLFGATVAFAARGDVWLVLVALAGLVFGAGLGSWASRSELLVRTPYGSGLWVRVESFRRFLAGSEGPQAEEAAKRGVLRQYTAWAVALDEVHQWERAVKAAGENLGAVHQADLSFAYLAPTMVSAAHATSVAPSSSVGAGGGGGAGGGFGGGGGGSW